MNHVKSSPLPVALSYAVLGALWILFSDQLAEAIAPDHHTYALIQTWKGWLFIAVTTLLLYLMLYREWSLLAAKQRSLDELESLLASNQAHARQMFEANPQPMWVFDQESLRVLAVNDAAIERYGYSREEWLAMTIEQLRPPEDIQRLHHRLSALPRRSVSHSAAWRHLRKDGGMMEVEIISLPMELDGRPSRMVIANDLTEIRASAERIRQLTSYDALTSLANRQLLTERLGQAITDARLGAYRCALLSLDLDRFKDVNDSLGHEAGDTLLRLIAGRLVGAVRADDTVARFGADHFMILLRHLGEADDVTLVAEKLQAAVNQPADLAAATITPTACIGIAVFPEDGTDGEALLRNADAALRHAIQMGRHIQQTYRPQMSQSSRERFALENDLRKAIEQGGLEVHYQLQVALAHGERKVTGLEALARWQHPVHGAIPPARFIPIAEESGLIVPLGAWVLRTACAQAAAWQAAGLPPLTMAVNLSAVQFRQPALAESVAEVLRDTGLEARWLELEVTESILMDDVERVHDILQDLCDQGVRIAIDDFGTGYSSLAYLRRMAVHKLKIDQSFVRGSPDDTSAAAIVRTIIQMARSLHLAVIAEGVEHQAQADYLRLQGCEEAQGYLYARPLPVEQVVHLLNVGATV
ncbi:MAG TPA: EAL domain-containing protein [Rhodocyclaceae bacterium]